jgi:hypothetical protein
MSKKPFHLPIYQGVKSKDIAPHVNISEEGRRKEGKKESK